MYKFVFSNRTLEIKSVQCGEYFVIVSKIEEHQLLHAHKIIFGKKH